MGEKYNFHRVDRVTTRGGGVGVFLSKELKVNIPSLSLSEHNHEIITLDIYSEFKRIRFRLIYRPPNTKSNDKKNSEA